MSAPSGEPGGKVTISGIAGRLGISKASVSYALNDQPGVSDATRARVVTLATELGWYPSSSARALSQSRSEAIGILLSRDAKQVGSEPFYMNVLAGIESVLSAHEMNLMLRIVAPNSGLDASGTTASGTPASGTTAGRDLAVYQRWAGERRVDGVILFDHLQEDPRPPLLTSLGLPYVRLGAPEGFQPGVKSADTTVAQSADAGMLVEALYRRGHRHIAYVSGPLALTHESVRLAAVLTHAQRLGMTAVSTPSDYSSNDGGAATIAVVAGLVPGAEDFPSGIIYGNDLMAMGGLNSLKQLGLEIPRQVSVLSWEDSILCQFSSPPVAALGRDIMALGSCSAALLLDIIAGHEPRNVMSVAGVLLERESLASASSYAAR